MGPRLAGCARMSVCGLVHNPHLVPGRVAGGNFAVGPGPDSDSKPCSPPRMRQALTPSLCQRVALLAGVLCKERRAGDRDTAIEGFQVRPLQTFSRRGGSGAERGGAVVVGWGGVTCVWGRR